MYDYLSRFMKVERLKLDQTEAEGLGLKKKKFRDHLRRRSSIHHKDSVGHEPVNGGLHQWPSKQSGEEQANDCALFCVVVPPLIMIMSTVFNCALRLHISSVVSLQIPSSPRMSLALCTE